MCVGVEVGKGERRQGKPTWGSGKLRSFLSWVSGGNDRQDGPGAGQRGACPQLLWCTVLVSLAPTAQKQMQSARLQYWSRVAALPEVVHRLPLA